LRRARTIRGAIDLAASDGLREFIRWRIKTPAPSKAMEMKMHKRSDIRAKAA
jgi:hypothetical protein